MVKTLWRRLKAVLKDRRGSVDILFILFAFFACVALAFPFSKVFVTNANLTSMAKIIVEDVEFRGIIDGQTETMIRQQLDNFALADNAPVYDFSGEIKPSGKIQLQDEFVFEITVTETLSFANFFDRPFTVNIPIHKRITGVSQNYYRDSEL